MSFIISTIIISMVGTLLHFLYDISKHNKIVGLFAAVNESTWEHIKIALTATIIWSLIDGYIYGINSNYFLAKFLSLMVIIVLIPLLFYSYKYIFNKTSHFVNVLIFYIAIVCSQFLFSYIITCEPISYFVQYLSCIGIYIIFACYMIFTLLPIKNFIFKDPISNKYGFKGHTEIFDHKNHE